MKTWHLAVAVLFPFVACGGASRSSTGTGGAGGMGTATTIAASSATGATGTSVTSSTSGTGGTAGTGGGAGGGAGGAGTGGENLCTGVMCTATDSCHMDGVCDPSTFMCSNPVKADGTTCLISTQCTDTATCQVGFCAGGVDQSQLLSPTTLDAYGQALRQTFTIGKTGRLTGIEVSLCNLTPPPSGGSYDFLLEHNGFSLSAVSIYADMVGSTCATLGATGLGPDYYDVSDLCWEVSAGQVYDFVITTDGFPDPVCGPSNLCATGDLTAACPVPGPDPVNCSYKAGVAASSSDVYAGGSLLVNGTATTGDLAFKTFVE